jgi:hypothetical protein
MLDVVYVAVAIAFFAVMLLYVSFCRVLGARAEHEERAS